MGRNMRVIKEANLKNLSAFILPLLLAFSVQAWIWQKKLYMSLIEYIIILLLQDIGFWKTHFPAKTWWQIFFIKTWLNRLLSVYYHQLNIYNILVIRMFTRIVNVPLKGKTYHYLRLIENYWENGKTKQRVVANFGNVETLDVKKIDSAIAGKIDYLTRSPQNILIRPHPS